MRRVTTPEDAEDKSSDGITSIRAVGAGLGYLKAVTRIHQQFCFWLHIRSCVWLVHCQVPQPSRVSFASMSACDTHHKAITATLRTNATVTAVKKKIALLMFYLVLVLSHPRNTN